MPDDSRRQILGVNPVAIAPPIGAEGVIGFEVTGLGNALLVSISGAPIVVAVNLDLADDEVAIGGPDSGGTRRLFQGRADGGNNIIESVSVLAGAQALALGKAEDTAFAGGDVGVPAYAVRRDADAPEAADGDWVPLHTDADGRLKVSDNGTSVTEFDRDTVAGAADPGIMALTVRQDAQGSPVGADGDYAPALQDADGYLKVGGIGTKGLLKEEDTAHVSGDAGVQALAVRRDVLVAPAADGDYVPLSTDQTGRLHVTNREDQGSTQSQTITAVAAGSVAIAAANAQRRAITIENRGPGPLYIRPGAAATTASFKLNRDQSIQFEDAVTGSWEGISNGAGASAVVISEEN